MQNPSKGLNLTGVFLEAKVFDALQANTAVKAKREEPYSTMTSEHFEGTIDVLATSMVSSDTALCLSIECKKANPEQKHWVFEKRNDQSEPEYYPFDYKNKEGAISYEKNIFFPSLGYDGMKFFDKAIQVYEFKEIDGFPSRNQVEKAYNAVKQANEATSSYIDDDSRVYDSLGRKEKELNILFLSIVVTTANLWTTKYSVSDVGWKEGTIQGDKLELEAKKWVIYEFPLPYHLRTRTSLGIGPIKRPSIIVNAENLEEFVSKLLVDSKKYILDIAV